MPALIQWVGAVPGSGFSMKASTRPSAASGTTPYRDGSSTSVRAMVAAPPVERWKAHSSATSRSVRTSPLRARNVLSIPAWRAAKAIAPPVSSGSGSTA